VQTRGLRECVRSVCGLAQASDWINMKVLSSGLVPGLEGESIRFVIRMWRNASCSGAHNATE
jgi:hypothetical protein